MSFEPYAPCESITKTIFYPCKTLVLKLKVVLGSRDRDAHRRKFIQEYTYDSRNKYIDVPKLSAYRVATRDYLVVEECRDWTNKNLAFDPNWQGANFLFSYENMHQLYWAIQTTYQWLSEPNTICEFERNGTLKCLKSDYINLCVNCTNRYGSDYNAGLMRFTPTIRSHPNGDREFSVLISMGKNLKQVASMNLDECSAWMYFLSHFDLFQSSMILTNQGLIASSMMKSRNTPQNK